MRTLWMVLGVVAAAALGSVVGGSEAEAVPTFPVQIDGSGVVPGFGTLPLTLVLEANGTYTALVGGGLLTTTGSWTWNGPLQRLRGIGTSERWQGIRTGQCFSGQLQYTTLGLQGTWDGCIVP